MTYHSKRWTIRNYNAALRALKRMEGLSHSQAQSAYRGMRDRLHRGLFAVEVAKHPRIRREEADKARGVHEVKNLDQFEEEYDGTGEWEEWESTLDVETKRSDE